MATPSGGREQGRLWAERLGLEFVDEYRDLGVSAFRGRNRTKGALAQFLVDAKSGKVERGDRLGGRKITPAFLQEEPWYWHQLVGELTRAHSESQAKSERLIATNKAKREAARAGTKLFAGLRCPGWLRPSTDNKHYEIIRGRDATIRQIFKWAADGIGTPTIAIRLNQAGIDAFDKRHRVDKQGGWVSGHALRRASTGLRVVQLQDERRQRREIEDE